MKVITRMVEDEVYEAFTSDNIKADIDMRELPLKRAQSPVELLLSALSACAAVDIVSMLKKRRKTIAALTIETEGERRPQPPRGFTSIHCRYIITSGDVSEDELHKVAGLALTKYCSVASTLNAQLDYSVQVIKR